MLSYHVPLVIIMLNSRYIIFRTYDLQSILQYFISSFSSRDECQIHIFGSMPGTYEWESSLYNTCSTPPHNWQLRAQSTCHRCSGTSLDRHYHPGMHWVSQFSRIPRRWPPFDVCNILLLQQACVLVEGDGLDILGEPCFPNLK